MFVLCKIMEIYKFIIDHSTFASTSRALLVKCSLLQIWNIFEHKFFQSRAYTAFDCIERIAVPIQGAGLSKILATSFEFFIATVFHRLCVDIVRKKVVTVMRLCNRRVFIPFFRLIDWFISA